MTESWNVEPTADRERPFVLMNASRTPISYSKRARFDVTFLLSEMEEKSIPLRFTDELEEIRFTVHKDAGTYLKNKIKLHSTGHSPSFILSVCKTFVHELGHHVDEREAISVDPAVVTEFKKRKHLMADSYARFSVGEYVGVGFEVFYFGPDDVRQRMRKNNPKLWRRISQAHRKYQQG